MKSLLSKTNVYDSNTLIKTMKILTVWFKKLESRGDQFPKNFDFDFFMLGITRALEQENMFSVCWTLHLILNTLHIYPEVNRYQMCEKLLDDKYFYMLFFHWSFNVR
mmetsp:Transcript_32096/g.23251  ORF Transcript_32096/g.23251 Transcript_32096/m.23251 type:complete len:107 (-) Transcript_32096:8-328(-)